MTAAVAPAPAAAPLTSASGNAWSFSRTTDTAESGHAGAWGKVSAGPAFARGDARVAVKAENGSLSVIGKALAEAGVGSATVGANAQSSVTLNAEGLHAKARVGADAKLGSLAAVETSAKGAASLTGRGLAANGKVAASANVLGIATADASVTGKASLGLTHADVAAKAKGTVTLGAAEATGQVGASAGLDRTGLTVNGNASVDARLGGLVASLNASASVKVDGEYPFLHINGTLNAQFGNA